REDNTTSAQSATGKDTFDESVIEQACKLIDQSFLPVGDTRDGLGHENLMKSLRDLMGLGRDLWPTAVLRQLWEAVFNSADGRKRTAGHERRWTNLAGFCLRPGYGFPHDD